MSLDGKVVVITGGAAGIGRACVDDFVRRGAQVAVADVAANGPGELFVKADVSQPDDVQALVRAVIDRFGRIDALVNNAAIQVNKTIEDTTPDEWARQMAVNVGGVFLCSKYFLPHLRESRGAIVNMS